MTMQMLTEGPIRTRREGSILEVTLDRPKANAIDLATSRIMGLTFRAFRDDDTLRICILRAEGEKFFCPGWDLKAAADGDAVDGDYGVGGFGGLQELPNLNKPVIAAVNGIAMGGGFELALACDLVIAAENAFFALSEPRVGLSALAGGVQYLPRAIGLPRAMGILLTGRRVPAKEGYELGFVTAVAPAGGAMEEARKWAAQMLECSPLALRATKEVARKTMLGEDFERKLVDAREFPAAKRLRTSNDYVEGPRAFAEKRKPQFTDD